jgi:predicted PurR-regulated permease PerM
MEPDLMTDDRFRKLFLALVVAGISVLFLVMIRGFVLTLLLAAIAGALLRPFYVRLQTAFGGRDRLAALVAVILLILVVFGPLGTIATLVVQQTLEFARDLGTTLKPVLANPAALTERLRAIPGMERFDPLLVQVAARAGELTTNIVGYLVSQATTATSGLVLLVVDLVIFLYALYFFFLEGPAYLRTLLAYLPFNEADGERLLARFESITRATLKGTLLVGAIQGTINGLGFWMVGLPAPAFWGAVMIVLSVVPAVGGALIWVPAMIWLALTGHLVAAVVLLVVCGAISGTVDNLIRPRLVGRDTRMPDLLILVSSLGGLGLFGAVGFIVGPLVAGLFLTLWEMLAVLYRPAPDAGNSDLSAREP